MIVRAFPPRRARRLLGCRSGVALMEFALALPILLTATVFGLEYANYISTRMRLSQLALHVADNGARIGEGTRLQAKRISEIDINDLFIGAEMQAEGLDLFGRGRVILSSFEPVAIPNTTNRYRIRWQRCRGARTNYQPLYGRAGNTNMTGMGPPGRQVTAPGENAVMFVELFYEYRPIFSDRVAPQLQIRETASMMVRERRDLAAQPYNTENAPVATC